MTGRQERAERCSRGGGAPRGVAHWRGVLTRAWGEKMRRWWLTAALWTRGFAFCLGGFVPGCRPEHALFRKALETFLHCRPPLGR